MNSPRGTAALFGVSVALLLMLCWWGGQFGPIGGKPLFLPGWSGHIPSGIFILLFGATWVLCLVVFLLFPRHLSPAQASFLIIGIALLTRLVLIPHPPSDDVNRYLWEGRLIREGISPYHVPPDHGSLLQLAIGDPYHPDVNHPDLSAGYPPLAIFLFAAAGGVS